MSHVALESDANRAVQSKKLARDLALYAFRMQGTFTISVAKIKALISCAVTAQLICDFVFAFI